MAQQSLKNQLSYCIVSLCSCFAAGGTAQKPIPWGDKRCVFLSHAGVPPSSSAGKRGPGPWCFFREVPTLHQPSGDSCCCWPAGGEGRSASCSEKGVQGLAFACFHLEAG